jgi:Tfp pilus assembly protein PilO
MDGILKVMVVMLAVIGLPMAMIYVVGPLMQSLGQRLAGDAADPGELDALRAEVEALRDLQPRMAELEERLDFAERLLARQDELAQLPHSKEAST